MTAQNLRGQFEFETGKPIEVYWEGMVDNPHYTEWLERKLIENIQLVADIPEYAKNHAIDFAEWYSGMERQKVINSYKSWEKEK